MELTCGGGGLARGDDEAAQQALKVVLARTLLQHLDHRRRLQR